MKYANTYKIQALLCYPNFEICKVAFFKCYFSMQKVRRPYLLFVLLVLVMVKINIATLSCYF